MERSLPPWRGLAAESNTAHRFPRIHRYKNSSGFCDLWKGHCPRGGDWRLSPIPPTGFQESTDTKIVVDFVIYGKVIAPVEGTGG
jgi:hypothetical protein